MIAKRACTITNAATILWQPDDFYKQTQPVMASTLNLLVPAAASMWGVCSDFEQPNLNLYAYANNDPSQSS